MRYQKLRKTGQSFMITQFGLSSVHVRNPEKLEIKTWNFYLFPRPCGGFDERFMCQASSILFLSDHGFDFNKFIADGVSFVKQSRRGKLQQKLDKDIANITNDQPRSISFDSEADKVRRPLFIS